jgi:hypothetical protein
VVIVMVTVLMASRLGLSNASSLAGIVGMPVGACSLFVSVAQVLREGSGDGSPREYARGQRASHGPAVTPLPSTRKTQPVTWPPRSYEPAARIVTRPPAEPAAHSRAGSIGSTLVLLQGAVGIVGILLISSPGMNPATGYPALCLYTVLVVAAVSALALRSRRAFPLGLLLGTCWFAAGAVISDIAYLSAHELFFGTGRYLAGSAAGPLSDCLGLAAVIVLMVSVHDVTDASSRARSRALAILLVSVVACSQITEAVWSRPPLPSAMGFSECAQYLLSLAAAWCAVSLRSRVVGAALLIGWAVWQAVEFASSMVLRVPFTSPRVAFDSFGCATAVVVVFLAVVYMRIPGLQTEGATKTP